MIDAINALLTVLLTALGAAPLAGIGAGAMTSLALVALTAAVVAAIVESTVSPRSTPWFLARPRRAIDASTLLEQSDPDAAGHARPRAPGIAAPAA